MTLGEIKLERGLVREQHPDLADLELRDVGVGSVSLRVSGKRLCRRTLPPRTRRPLVCEFLDDPDLECIFMRTFLRLTPGRF
ncbi:hypothetical protein BDB13_5747 [Rhodococcus sp. OK302]|nr:hypothetical protein BDB13_5747 [Rhodococcus sp. OK302]